ncbi:helix-turn-helix domain-containing protein [Pseudoalteromonas fenneropenaei]|uniref:Helix-turn-helix domain-containing protein n=1 Tax=Pseudoalteromonas fenneropenaei TaxID=1737459 RepID=A0ABV7CNM5_9GAMM
MHTSDDFKSFAKQASSAQLRMRYLALYHFKRGESRTQTAINLGVARGSVNTWVSNYLEYWLDKPGSARTRQLSESQQKQLKRFIQDIG